MSADLSSILGWQADPCGHGYFSGGFDVLCCQVWIFVDSYFCQFEECFYSFFGYPSSVCVHGGFYPVVCFIVDVSNEARASNTVTFLINVLSLVVITCPFMMAIHAFVFCVSRKCLFNQCLFMFRFALASQGKYKLGRFLIR